MPVFYMMAGFLCGGLAALSSVILGHPILMGAVAYSVIGSLSILAIALGLNRDFSRTD